MDLDRLLDTCIMCKGSYKEATRETSCFMCRKPPNYPLLAPEGQVFVCSACGKKSKKLLGDEPCDESCMVNATLCYEDSLEFRGGLVVGAKAVEGY